MSCLSVSVFCFVVSVCNKVFLNYCVLCFSHQRSFVLEVMGRHCGSVRASNLTAILFMHCSVQIPGFDVIVSCWSRLGRAHKTIMQLKIQYISFDVLCQVFIPEDAPSEGWELKMCAELQRVKWIYLTGKATYRY